MKFLYKNTSRIEEKEILKAAKPLDSYISFLNKVVKSGTYNTSDDQKIDSHAGPFVSHGRKVLGSTERGKYDVPESSINLPDDHEVARDVQTVVQKLVTRKLKYVVVVGIGGSNLGAKAVYDAMYGYVDTLEPARFPKMLFADTCDSEFLQKLGGMLQSLKSPDEILINVISKSGTTTETVVNAELIIAMLARRFKNAATRLVVTTDVGSKLWKLAKERKFSLLQIPKEVGGRYSMFSSVGLFPLAACGIDIGALKKGALAMRKDCLLQNIQDNPAVLSATLLFLHYKNGKNIHDTFLFHPELESLGKWYRQLMAESLGKEKDSQGKTVRVGITPTVSVGSTDLHSVAQLYLGGPKDKFTTFVINEDNSLHLKLGEITWFSDLVDGIGGKSAREVMSAIYHGVRTAYEKNKLPFIELYFDDFLPYNLGAFMQFKMFEIMYLGKLLNVNAFDQENVEEYKAETRKILNRK